MVEHPEPTEGILDEIDGVVESAVIGVPHADFGEAVVAVIATAPGASLSERDVIEYSRPRMANFKVPKRVFSVTSLPRNAMGKVQKNLLRERYADSCKT